MEEERLGVFIVDDEPSSCETLHGLLKLTNVPYQLLGTANTKKDAVRLVRDCDPDLVFLDIELVEATGFDVIQELGDHCPIIVFTTAHDQYAVDAFRVGAIDFLLKPLSIGHLTEAMNRAIEKKEKKEKSVVLKIPERNVQPSRITIRSSNRVDYVVPTDVLYVEVQGSYCTFFLVNGNKVVATGALKDYADLLGAEAFCRISHSVLVNLDHVKGYKRYGDKCIAVLENDEQVIVTRRKRTILLDALNARYGGTRTEN